MNLSYLLQERAAAGRPVRFGLIGAGKFGSMILSQVPTTPGLEAAGVPLYAQHVDAMDNATLVDVFRAEENACLLGTDAMRDGVDVPGRSLRLLKFRTHL